MSIKLSNGIEVTHCLTAPYFSQESAYRYQYQTQASRLPDHQLLAYEVWGIVPDSLNRKHRTLTKGLCWLLASSAGFGGCYLDRSFEVPVVGNFRNILSETER